jgi:hypothetical protein
MGLPGKPFMRWRGEAFARVAAALRRDGFLRARGLSATLVAEQMVALGVRER